MKKNLLLLFLIIAAVLPAFSQRVLKDIAQGTDNANIFSTGAFSYGDTLFFKATTDLSNFYNYYYSNGTDLTTKKLISNSPNYGSPDISTQLIPYKFKNDVYLVSYNKIEIIKKDTLQALRQSGFGNFSFLGFFELNNQLHFLIRKTNENVFEFWKTDGTANGTVMYKSVLSPTPINYSIKGFALGNKYFHTYNNGTINILETDGTAQGTITYRNSKISMMDYQPFGSYVYYNVNRTDAYWYRKELWKSRGDSLSSQKVLSEIDGDPNFGAAGPFVLNNNLFFISSAYNQTRISRLDTINSSVTHVTNPINFITSFTVSRNKMYYADVNNTTLNLYENAGSLGSNTFLFSLPYYEGVCTIYKGESNLYVSQQRFENGQPSGDVIYWIYNGSSLIKLADLVPDISLGIYYNAVGVVGNIFYFSASDAQHGYELWRTDGTVQGTFMVKDLNSQIASSKPKLMFDLDNFVYFTANDLSNGNEIWRTNGTATSLYANMNAGSTNSISHTLGSTFRSKVKFRTSFLTNITYKFYEFTNEGNINPISSLPVYNTSSPSVIGDTLYFMGNDGNLWKAGNLSTGIKMVHLDSTNNGTGNWGANRITKIGNSMYFTSNYGSRLWRSNGTKNSTLKLAEFGINEIADDGNGYLWLSNDNTLFFKRFNLSLVKAELWASNGTISGTIKLPFTNFFNVLGVFNNNLYYNNNNELWKSDGTLAGTSKIDNRSFSAGSPLNDKFYLIKSGNYSVEYYELNKSNQLTFLNSVPINDNFSINPFYLIDNRYLLNYISTPTHQHFILTDGNEENIKNVFTLKKSKPIGSDYDFLYHNKKIYFTAVDSLKGQELWIWDFECPDGYTIRDNITKDSTIVYGKNIWGQNVVSNNKTVTYDAKNSITLQPGFEAQRGTVFKTKLIGCTNTNTSNVVEDETPSKNEPIVKVNTSATYPQLIDFLNYLPNKHLKEIYEQAQQTKLAPVSWDIVTEKDIYRLDLKIGSTVLKGFLPKKN